MDPERPEDPTRRRLLQIGAGIGSLVASWPGRAWADPASLTSDRGRQMNTTGFEVPRGDTRTGEHFQMKGVTTNTLDVKVSGADTDGRLAVLEQIGQSPNGGPPLHAHLDQDEIFIGVEGRYRFVLGGRALELGPGDVIFAPRGVPHAFMQRTEVARMQLVYQPAGLIEDFFRATASWTSPPSTDEIARVFAAHGMRVLGPPLKPD